MSRKLFILPLILLSLSRFVQAETPTDASFEGLVSLTTSSTIPELQELMASGVLTAVELTEFYVQQIERKDDAINAIIMVNPKALAIAQALDDERAAGKLRGPLHGIPIVLKDNIETFDMPTTAGSLALRVNDTHRDATLTANLRKAGAVILAKANLSEWANFRSERSSSGWSGVGGQTRNPVDLNRSPCGSSAGSGAAVAANLAVAAIGTETDGSVTCPSAATGIVGIKPTVGLVSRYGVVPLSHTQDTAGPMAKSVTDAALLLEAMQGPDQQDLATQSAGIAHSATYPAKGMSLKGLRIGLLASRVNPHEGVVRVYNEALMHLAHAGAVLVPDLELEEESLSDDSYTVLLYEFKHNLNRYLASLPNALNTLTLESLIRFNLAHAAEEMPFFQQEIFIKAQEKGELTDAAYLDALGRIQVATRADGLDRLVNDNQLDIIVTPTLGPAWSIDQINGGKYTGGYSSPSAIAGYPHLTLPMGYVHHLPIGMSVVGLANDDAKVISVALSIEALLLASTKAD